ncbi:ATP-grasp domain-containing protein [Hamadaea tsunoensis]|uniref:ATP-grasp domain-containing protein n=1 Tax=Hamadaea tsunoensis TaxID=53368 RepID=UPI000418543B|nr:hypothetical protein [Hamadaea tsunoensis]
MNLALVTSLRFPESHWSDADTPLVAAQLSSWVRVDVPAWDDPAVDWSAHETVVLQSPWSMWLDLPAFRSWLDERVAAGVRVLNPPPVILRGCDKRYLAELAEAGVATVPTTFVDSGWSPDRLRHELAAALPSNAARRTIVVKPVASGGSLGAAEFADVDEAAQHIAALRAAGSDAMVQPYIESIDTHRELGVVTMGPDISHAISKAAILQPGTRTHAFHPDPRPARLTDAQLDVVRGVHDAYLRLVGTTPLSVRLDFIPDPEAGLLLLEIEAVAPVRFLRFFPDAVRAYGDLILEAH